MENVLGTSGEEQEAMFISNAVLNWEHLSVSEFRNSSSRQEQGHFLKFCYSKANDTNFEDPFFRI